MCCTRSVGAVGERRLNQREVDAPVGQLTEPGSCCSGVYGAAEAARYSLRSVSVIT
jgi:hypothetical protein